MYIVPKITSSIGFSSFSEIHLISLFIIIKDKINCSKSIAFSLFISSGIVNIGLVSCFSVNKISIIISMIFIPA